MSDSRYNGWLNYETWLANLWLTNGGSDILTEMATEALNDANGDKDEAAISLSISLESIHDEQLDSSNLPDYGFFADLLNSALRAVDWREIAENALSDIDYTKDED